MTNMRIKPGIRPGMSMEDRFWEKVQKSGTCWNWMAALFKNDGYGKFRVSRERPTVRAQRVSWEIHFGAIDSRVNVLHRCDNPRCVRPDHLFLGSLGDNSKDMVQKGRHGSALFNEEKASRIRGVYHRHKDILSYQRIADWFGVSKATISHMMTGRNWGEANGEVTLGVEKRGRKRKI